MLSKSRILAARQCRRRLWLEINRPALRIRDTETLRRLDQGRQLNALVHALYPDGRRIEEDITLDAAIDQTEAHLAHTPGRPLFEATFSAHRALVRADILQRDDNGGLRLTEVKASTRVKAHHLVDCAIQNWVINEAGYPVKTTFLAHIDRRFRYRGDEDYAGLLRHVDVSERVGELVAEVPGWIAEGLDVLSQTSEPPIAVGPHCHTPFGCPFIGHCAPPGPEYPLKLLPGGGRIIDQLRAEGIEDVRDIPDGRLHKPLQERVRRATISGRPYIDAALGEALRTQPYPRYFLDFESSQFAIPRWPGSRPYEQLPFQWSCHIVTRDGGLRHEEFLDTSGASPLRRCAETLIDALGDGGPIFSYSRFERTVINQLAAHFRDLSSPLHSLVARLVDLLPLIRTGYYHPAMHGSFSIKAVLPTVAPDLGYEGLGDVHDGIGAQLAYEELIDAATPADRRETLARALREYCRLDTLAMVRLVDFFDKTPSTA